MNNLKKVCLLISVLFIFAFYLVACSTSAQNANDLTATQNTKIPNSNSNQFNVAEFERNRELWTSKNIQNYKMIVDASGFLTNFPEQVLIEVRNRQAKSIKSLSKTGRNYVEAYKNYDTVEKIFDFVESSKKADKLIVKFNENLGYPTGITRDGRINVSDDELQLKIYSLEIDK